MAQFQKQYNLLGLKVPSKKMDAAEKAEIIFHAACKRRGVDPAALPQVYHLPEEFQVLPVVSYKLELIATVLRDGAKVDWNSSQKKWGAWFWMNNPGFRFNGAYYATAGTHAGLGSRLCSLDDETAEFLATECVAFWADFNGGQLPQ